MHIRDVLSRQRAAALPLGLALLLAAAGPAPAQEKKTPVEVLEQALDLNRGSSEKADLDARRKAVEKAADDIRTFGQAAQGLLAFRWSDEEGSNLDDVRQRLLKRFLAGIDNVLASGDTGARAAVATLVGEFAVTTRGGTGGRANALVQLSFVDIARMLSARAAKDASPRVREAAARALGKVRAAPDVTATALEAILKDRTAPADVRRAAAEALIVLIHPATGTDRTGLVKQSSTTTQDSDVADFGKEIVHAAALGLDDPDPQVRRSSITAIEQVASALTNYLRVSAGGGLGEGRAEAKLEEKKLDALVSELWGAVPALTQALGDDSPAVRLLAARSLEELGESRQRWQLRAAPGTRPEPKPSDKRTRLGAAGLVLVAAEEAADEDAVQPGRPALVAAIDGLIARLGDADVKIRLAAVDALEAITTKVSEPGAQKEVTQEALLRTGKALTRSLGDNNRFVRWSAARTLGKLGALEGVKGGAVAGLVRLLSDSDQGVRETAAVALERYGADAAGAVPALSRAVNEGDADVRQAAIRALVAVGKSAAPAVPALAQALGDPQVRIRRAAAEALSKLAADVQGASEALQKALNDPDPDVRRFASDALLKDRLLPG